MVVYEVDQANLLFRAVFGFPLNVGLCHVNLVSYRLKGIFQKSFVSHGCLLGLMFKWVTWISSL